MDIGLSISVDGANLEECVQRAHAIARAFYGTVEYHLASVWAEPKGEVPMNEEGQVLALSFSADFNARPYPPAAAGDSPPVA